MAKGELIMEDARIIFRNFAGKEGQYNREGDRNFCILLDEKTATEMAEDGWNVKTLRAREQDEPPQPYIQVSVGYKGRPPLIVLITSKGRTPLGPHEIELLDWVEIKLVDLIVRPFEWLVNGKSGVKAYLKTLYLVVQEDYLKLKYDHVPEIGAAPERLQITSGQGDLDMIDGEVIEFEDDDLLELEA